MRSIQELEAIRESTLENMTLRKEHNGTRIVVGIHGNSSVRKLQVSFWRKQIIHHFVLFLAGKHIEGIPIQFIKSCSKSRELYSFHLRINFGHHLTLFLRRQ